jgi:hypothetical protein
MQIRKWITVESRSVADRLRLLVWSVGIRARGKAYNLGRNRCFYNEAMSQGLIPDIDWESKGVTTVAEMFRSILGAKTTRTYSLDAFTQCQKSVQLDHLLALEQATEFSLIDPSDRRQVLMELLEAIKGLYQIQDRTEAIAAMESLIKAWRDDAAGEVASKSLT